MGVRGSREEAGWAELWIKCGSVLPPCGTAEFPEGSSSPRRSSMEMGRGWVREEQGRCQMPAAGTTIPNGWGALQTFGVC